MLGQGGKLEGSRLEISQAATIPVEHRFGVWDGVVLRGVRDMPNRFIRNQKTVKRKTNEPKSTSPDNSLSHSPRSPLAPVPGHFSSLPHTFRYLQPTL